MDMPPALLQCIGKAVLQSAAGSLLGEFAVEVLPEIAQDAWKSWSSGRDADELRADVEAVAQAEPEDVRSWAEEVLEPIAGGQPPKVRDAVAAYLTQVPGAIRQALRRPSEPT